ncbi:Uncharacterised protein [Budvicia aquatica]|uniref:TamA POTRA domain-containing protein n=1 Tax=Budvicia aquatica TaxID=82979 RepID=A0A484ZHD0_9GAMM|nr:Uncharacterised protein [Budvicia aquatica]
MPRTRYRMSPLLLLFVAVSSAKTADLSLDVKGLSGDLEQNVRALLSTIPDDEIANTPRFTRRVDDEIRRGLRAKGYYDPEIRFEVVKPALALKPVLTAIVEPGDPVRIEETRINIEGQAREDEAYIQLLKTGVPPDGTILDHGTYDSFKSSLTGLAIRRAILMLISLKASWA